MARFSHSKDASRTVAGHRVSKRHAEQRVSLFDYIRQKTGLVVGINQCDHEWLRLIREPQFQDMYNRRAQAEVVVEAATGSVADRKLTGRLLTMKCLDGGVGKTEAKKRKRRARVVIRREVEGVLIGEVVGSEEFAIVSEDDESGGIGADADADGDDGMEVDGHNGLFGSNDGNDDDGMDLDDTSNFNDSGLPPSSPTPGYGLPPPKTPAQHLFAAALPTPDSTPFAQWPQAHNFGGTLDDKDRRLQEKDAQIAYLIAVAEGRGYEVDTSEVDAYFAAWAGYAT